MINRALPMNLGDVFEQLGLSSEDLGWPGSPSCAADRCRPIAASCCTARVANWESTLPFSELLHLTTSRDILTALAEGRGPSNAVVALGYAGWDAGQLDDEMARNAWLNVSADVKLLFDTPLDDRWREAGRLLGVNLMQMSGEAGRA